MQPSTIIVLACLVAVVAASVQYNHLEELNVQNVHESLDSTPVHERSARTKRGLLLLKKKLILGALGLKAAKVGLVGAGVVGALALKKKQQSVPRVTIETDYHGYWFY
ncbi:unnamed protein product [Euphydryas editha]|uniref:Uncharacterized protein n=1 Tax=Euphydryas editha TaxID=104508 RepID=A0AAU9UWX8_EUPED|nr:unnamed protein product [Euphydryas editha]